MEEGRERLWRRGEKEEVEKRVLEVKRGRERRVMEKVERKTIEGRGNGYGGKKEGHGRG